MSVHEHQEPFRALPTHSAGPSPRLIRAINTAAWAHRNQTRKASELPYVSHVFGVMALLAQVTDDEDVLIAGLFHDIIEDVPEEYSAERMTEEFGQRVVDLVQWVTKNDDIQDWQARSEAYLARLAEAPVEAIMIAAADKLHNLLTSLDDLEHTGEKFWQRFSAPKDRQHWWYGEVLAIVQRRLPGHPLTLRLAEAVADIQKT